jgi:hypothetical protein
VPGSARAFFQKDDIFCELSLRALKIRLSEEQVSSDTTAFPDEALPKSDSFGVIHRLRGGIVP